MSTPPLPPPESDLLAPAFAPEEEPADAQSWRLWIAPAAIVLGLGLGIVATILVDIVAAAAGGSLAHPSSAVSIIGDVVFDLGFVAAALYFAGLHGRVRAADFGFRWPGAKLGLSAVLAAGVGYYVLTTVYANVFSLNGNEKLPSELGVNKSTAALAAAAVFVCVIAPIAEEFFFRGFIFGVLRRMRIELGGRHLGPWVAAVLTGILFGLAHTGSASSQYLIPLGFLGFVLCLVRWRTGSLYPCMALHSINNSLALGVNQLKWNGGEIVALIVGALVVIGALTGPLAGRSLQLG
ncbi:MAG: type II CAAX endopeptidase family protein [Solirubrobacteraceae bacterium]